MNINEKLNLDDFDAIESWFPKPLHLLMRCFKVEVKMALKHIIQSLDLVTKDEYLVQKRLLDEAYIEIERLKNKA